MFSWFFSLQFRLIAGFALALALALTGVSLYVGMKADREAERLQASSDEARELRIKRSLESFYKDNDGWKGLQPLLEWMGFVAGRDIAVLDHEGRLVGDTPGKEDVDTWVGHYFKPVVVNGEQVGEVYVGKGVTVLRSGSEQRELAEKTGLSDKSDLSDRSEKKELAPAWARLATTPIGESYDDDRAYQEPLWARFTDVTDQSLLLSGAIAGPAGLLLVFLMSRRMLRSVRSLTAASQKMGAGDLSQRVPSGGRDEVGRLARTFNAMASDLERAQQQRRNMVADVAHEIRGPLSNVQGYVEAVRDGVLPPDQENMGTIHRQVLHLSDLVEDLQLLAETEGGDFRLHHAPGSLTDALLQAVEGVRARAEAKGVALNVILPDESPVMEFDRTRIVQVVDNLLSNAVRHTPSGDSVTVEASFTADRAQVAVSDTGDGIPADALPLVFDRFYRVDPSRSRATGGVGLGLTIARQLVEAHGGVIRAESETGHGARFTFEIPIRSGTPSANPPAPGTAG